MYKRVLFLFCAFCLFYVSSFAQIVGGNVYLQGAYLEIGEASFGAFGTCTPPAGYHSHCTGCSGGSAALAEVYDYGHDGWGVGTPPEMGDYTQPGTPFEGWSLEVAGVEYDNWVYGDCNSSFLSAPEIPGSITGYTNSGGSITGTFTGAVAGLSIVAESRVDTLASAVVVTVRVKNTTGATVPGIYYSRTCDPDNVATLGSGSLYTTHNVIVHQNEDAAHNVLVSATSDYPATYAPWTYMGLGTKDCRAVATFLAAPGATFGGFPPAYLPSQMWSKAAITGYAYGLHDSAFADCGIALIFNIGSLAPVGTPGDSAVVCFTYEFNGIGGLDSALPSPQLVVAGYPLPNISAPGPTYDTFDVCSHPGDDSVVVDILHAATGNWTWSRWHWAPSTGLTSTTGIRDTILSSVLPPSITYTITGTDSSGSGVMLNCENVVFYLTITTCNSCVNNSPCEGDSLLLQRKGDSTGCTYYWYGPAGFTSTMQDPYRYPATLADAGEYYVIRTLLGAHDTDSTHVTIHPLPVIVASSNAPLCSGIVDTLDLFVTPLDPSNTFSWTGPAGFTSALADPTIPGFMPSNAGTYQVVVTTPYGCRDSATTDALQVPPPPAPPIVAFSPYCYGAAFIPFIVTGTDIIWYAHDTSTVGTATTPNINTSAAGTYTFFATQQIGSCISPKDSVVVTVLPRIVPRFDFTMHRGCASDEVDFVNTTLNSNHYTWNFGDATFATDSTPAYIPHAHVYARRDSYLVMITGYNIACSLDTTITVDTRHSVLATFFPAPDTFCIGQSPLFNDGSYGTVYLPAAPAAGSVRADGPVAGYLWDFGDGSATLSAPSNTTSATHEYDNAGTYKVTLVVTDTIGCKDTTSQYLYALQLHIKSVNDTTLCLSLPLPLYNTITLTPNINITDYNYVWHQSSQNLDDSFAHVPYVTGFGDFVDTLTVTLPGVVPDGCPAYDTITIHSIKGVAIEGISPNQTIPYGSSVNLASSGEVRYYWLPNNGTLNDNNINNPVATPLITTTYTVFGYDYNGCLDSAAVTITVDSVAYHGFPGAFTPNDDGLNDIMHPLGLKYEKLIDYRIYNRWGQEVFYSNDANKGWDGKFNGVPQDIGVYYYVMVVANPGGDGKNTVYKGNFTLLR